jgi:hypothetical protein
MRTEVCCCQSMDECHAIQAELMAERDQAHAVVQWLFQEWVVPDKRSSAVDDTLCHVDGDLAWLIELGAQLASE